MVSFCWHWPFFHACWAASISLWDQNDFNLKYTARVDDDSYKSVFEPGYEYMARLQVIEANQALCPTEHNETYNLTVVPADMLPVVILATEGNCTLQDRIDLIREYIYPKDVVKYLIVADDGDKMGDLGQPVDTSNTATTNQMQKRKLEVRALVDYEYVSTGDWPANGTGVLHVFTSVSAKLSEAIKMQDEKTSQAGGLRVILDGGRK